MFSITNAAEDLAFSHSHTQNVMQAQSPSFLTCMRRDTDSIDNNRTFSPSLASLNPQTGATDHEHHENPGQNLMVGESRMHRIEDNNANISSVISPDSTTRSRTFRRPPRYTTKDNHQFSYASSNCVKFDAKKQLLRTLVHGLWRWLVTLSFVGVLMASIRHYKSQEVLSSGQVAMFTAINVKVSIIVGINISSALKKMALSVRWRVLSQRVRPLSEVRLNINKAKDLSLKLTNKKIDMFLQCDSLLGLIKAAYITKRPKVIMDSKAYTWSQTVQIGLATLNLAYSMDSTVQHAIFKPDSQIWVTNFEKFRSVSDHKIHKMDQSSIAHNRGIDGPATKNCHVSDPGCRIPVPGTTRGNISTDYWRFDSYWQYTFLEHPPYRLNKSGVGESPSRPGDLSVFSGQSVITNGNCEVSAAWITTANNTTNWTFKSDNEKIQGGNGLPGSTKFFIPDTKVLPTCSNDYSSHVWAYETGPDSRDDSSNKTGWFYQCCISVNETTYPDNQDPASRRIQPKIARIAAAAIGLQGFRKTNHSSEYQIFQENTYFGSPQNGNATAMAMLISEFTIRIFASSGYENPMEPMLGRQPQQGSKLNINNATLMNIILPFIVGIHLACLVTSALLTYRIAVPDSSPLSIANTLYQYIKLLGGRGSLLTGPQIADVLGNPHMVYTAASLQNGTYRQAVFQSQNSADSRVVFHDGIYL
ncbi:hypothetical protein NHQ30_011186 [Ciborinia camelliae]|nr:hypothetical protein NHQ30_011186 [Ciborinia camelliae]